MDHIPSYESTVQRENGKEQENRGFQFGQESRLPYFTPANGNGRQLRNTLQLNIEGGGAYGDSTESILLATRHQEERRNWQGPVHIAGSSGVGGEGHAFLGAGRGVYNGNVLALEERDMGRGGRLKGASRGILEHGRGLSMADAGERWENRVQLSEDRVFVQRGGECEQGNWNKSKQRILEVGDTLGYGDFAESPETSGIRCMYRDCQKNQAPDRGTHSVDGCGEFLPEGRENKCALTCAACGCHRNFHRRVKVGEDDREEERGRGAAEGNPNASIGTIEAVAQKLMEAASRAIPLLSFDPRTGRAGDINVMEAGDINVMEHSTLTRILVENLDYIAKVTLSTAECLTLLQKSSSRHSSSSRDRDNRGATSPLAGHPRGPFSSDVSPVSTVEKRVHTPPPFSLQQFNTNNQQAIENPTSLHLNTTMASGAAQQQAADSGSKCKRKRTRISEKQKLKLTAFGEQAGWTVVGQRKETIDAACADIGVEPKTLKYWIHNSKQKLKRPEEVNVLGR